MLLLVGDSYVQGLQVNISEHMAQQLDALTDDESMHFFTTGMSDFGATTYLNTNLYSFIWDDLAPDEIIVFFNPANDFQYVTVPTGEAPLL